MVLEGKTIYTVLLNKMTLKTTTSVNYNKVIVYYSIYLLPTSVASSGHQDELKYKSTKNAIKWCSVSAMSDVTMTVMSTVLLN